MKITKQQRKIIEDAYLAYKQMLWIELNDYKEAFVKAIEQSDPLSILKTDDDFRQMAITGIIHRLKQVVEESKQMQDNVNFARDLLKP